MRRDDTLVDRVRVALGRIPRVEERKMFGGTAFLVRGKICVSARQKRIMCRIDRPRTMLRSSAPAAGPWS